MNLNINPAFPSHLGRFSMQPYAEVILATLPGSQDDEQVEIALCQLSSGGSLIEFRQQTWGDGIGWFTQSRVQMEPHQLADLRAVLGTGAGRSRTGSAQALLPREFSHAKLAPFTPRVVHADSA